MMPRPARARSPAQPFADRQAVRSGAACADNTEQQRFQQLDASAEKQRHRRVEDLAQQRRVPRVGERNQLRAGLPHLLLLHHRVFERAAAGDALGHAAGNAVRFQFASRGAQNALGRAKALEEFLRGAGSQARNHFEGKPVEFVLGREDRRQGGHQRHGAAGARGISLQRLMGPA